MPETASKRTYSKKESGVKQVDKCVKDRKEMEEIHSFSLTVSISMRRVGQKQKDCQQCLSDQKLKVTEKNALLPDCHTAMTECQQRTALTLFRPCELKEHVPNRKDFE